MPADLFSLAGLVPGVKVAEPPPRPRRATPVFAASIEAPKVNHPPAPVAPPAVPAAAVVAPIARTSPDFREIAEAATAEELRDPAFVAVASAMHGWRIQHQCFPGLLMAGAGHVRTVLRHLRAEGVLPGGPPAPRASAAALLRQALHATEIGHLVLAQGMGEGGQKVFAAWQASAIQTTEGMHV